MINALIKTLLNHLPRFAEEEGDFYSVSREDLINALCLENETNREIAENTVDLIENLLDSLAVLNSYYLQKGDWCFVSFPAQLLAMSILTAMSSKDSRFFADNFWNTNGIANARKEQQRDILREIESRRQQYHIANNAPPIRYIYVAWSIIKIDDHILFYQREDTRKNFVSQQAGDYGLLGGRLNQRDMAYDDKKSGLQQLQSNNATVIKKAIGVTLKRELHEEAGLIFETHYTFKLWRSLKPYRQVQGSAPNHALTEYYLDIFFLDLTLAGYLFLQEKIKSDERLVWFSLSDIERGKKSDDKVAYIHALFNDFADRADLIAELRALSTSFDSRYLFQHDKYALTLLQNTDKPLLAGVLGKEKSLDVVLTQRQQQLLVGLAAHHRGFAFATLTESVLLHPHGWLELQADTELAQELIELVDFFQKTPQTQLWLEQQQNRFFRWSIERSLLYFDPQLFTYTVGKNLRETKITIEIKRTPLSTPLGNIAEQVENFGISRILAQGLANIHCGIDEESHATIESNYKKTLAKEPRFLALGLKGLLRCEQKNMRFCVAYREQ